MLVQKRIPVLIRWWLARLMLVLLACHLHTSLAALSQKESATTSGNSTNDGDWVDRVESLVREQAHGLAGELILQTDPLQLAQRSACDELSIVKPAGFRLRSRMTLSLRCVSPQRWSTYVEVQARLHANYWVAAKTLRPGDVLGPESYEVRAGDLLALPNDVLLDRQQMLGFSARQRIPAGQALRAGALRSTDAVLRGALVKLTFQGKGFTISRDGAQALEEGTVGSTIAVRTANGHIVSGVVRGSGLVELSSP